MTDAERLEEIRADLASKAPARYRTNLQPDQVQWLLAEIDRLRARVAELEEGVRQIDELHWVLSGVVGREGCVSQAHCENWPCPTHRVAVCLLLPEEEQG